MLVDQPLDAGKLGLQRRRRRAGGRRGIVEIVEQRGAGDQHIDRFGVGDIGELGDLAVRSENTAS